MNLYLFEIRSYIRSAIIWIASIILMFMLLMNGMFPLYMDAADSIEAVLANFPPAFAQAFGIAIGKMFTFGGFYSFSFGYISLIAGVMASSLAITVFAREKKAKSLDFILTKPISRTKIFFNKLFACITILFMVNLVYEIFFVIVYYAVGEGDASLGRVIYGGAGVFFTQLLFLGFGIVFALTAKKIRSISGTGTLFGVTAFILSSLANVLEEETMYYIAPLKYFEPYRIFDGENYEGKFVVAAILILAVCLSVAYWKFIKSDTRQV